MTRQTIVIMVLLRVALGSFWMDHGIDKMSDGWITDDQLKARLVRSSVTATGLQKAYLEHFAVPASGALRYLVMFGELAIGLAFLAGFWMKPAAWGAGFMVLNFKFADGRLLDLNILGDPSFFPLLLTTLLIAYINFDRSWTLRRFFPILDRYDV
ncbi:MAG: DoxX family protein [Fidelibacterota bacterium]|nr:MAG: DoxX family protein [Candidatus Neomarinimicrobiota bacterium]